MLAVREEAWGMVTYSLGAKVLSDDNFTNVIASEMPAGPLV